jgi:flagellar assembly factor FliW
MLLGTTRFGELDIEPSAIYTFTQPIIGFQEFRRFVHLPGPDGSSLSWLQSTDSSELAFLLIDPKSVAPEYEVVLSPHEMVELAATTMADVEILTLLVVPADPTKVRTNLKAPIVLNPRHRLGKQTVLDRSDYPIQFFLAQAKQTGGAGSPGGKKACSF